MSGQGAARRGTIRVAAALLALSGLVATVAGCSTGPHRSRASRSGSSSSSSTAPSPARTGAGGATWILTRAALNDLTASPGARARLSGARIFEILTGTERPATALPVVPTMSFKSFATLQDTLTQGTLRPDVRAVIYDAEHWQLTPPREQRDPASFYRRAAALAHAHGLIFIATPAMDLVTAVGGKSADPAAAFLDRRIAASAALDADVVDIQSQSLERDSAAFKSFVSQAADQIRAANPKATVLAGLSTNPPGSEVTTEMLVAAMVATSGSTTGFWLNIPGKGNDCPHCNTPRPDLAVAALQDARLAQVPAVFAPPSGST